jgi:hypothetical protein
MCSFPRPQLARSPHHGARWLIPTVVFALASSSVAPAAARPGTHPIVVSTWDSRASSVLLQYRHGMLDDGSFNTVTYEANFSSTSGKLSSQFGLHYLNFSEGDETTAHGLSATATALFNLPVASRFDNGLARAAIAFYVGSAPTALVSGQRNYLSIPIVLGVGVPISPARPISITPWFEFSPGANLDTVIHEFELSNVNPDDYVTPDGIELTEEDVEQVLRDSVELDVSASVGARAGLDLALHASDAFDLTASASISSVGTAFSGARVIYLGGGFVWRWDDIVPAVLPADKRLLYESCDAIEERFRACPNARRWKRPDENSAPPARAAEPSPPPPTPASPDPAPAPLPPTMAPPSAEPPAVVPVPAPAETPGSSGSFPSPAEAPVDR